MRDMVSCFSEHAIRVSETTCSSHTITTTTTTTNHHLHQMPISINNNTTTQNSALQTSVSLMYKITLSSNKQFLVTITWSSTIVGPQGLTISLGEEDPSSSTAIFKLSTTSRLFRKKKGSKFIELEEDDSRIELFWDLSEVIYGEFGAEPIKGYSILLMMDSEIALVLGDLNRELASKKIKNGSLIAKNALVSRKEHYSGTTLYSTKAKFSENGAEHEISIKCSGESDGLKQPVLVVSLDKRTVMKVKRLQWNFRGNQTIFSDGLLIDLFWDVHDWFFSSGNGGLAVFMFRKRIGIESRLWLEEKLDSGKKKKKDDQDKNEFSLLIYASKI